MRKKTHNKIKVKRDKLLRLNISEDVGINVIVTLIHKAMRG